MNGVFQEISVAFRYAIIGVINTVIGYSVFLIMLMGVNMSPNTANAVGYLVALLFAFYLNRSFVFDVNKYKVSHYIKFIFSFVVAFGLNQLVLWWLVYSNEVNPKLAQIVSMVFYTVIFYASNRFFVYR